MMKNELVKEKSPYLLHHSKDPIYWRRWSESLFKEAKNTNKIIFISIGYSSCHWCHVMQKESFSNQTIADFLNQHFISIKIDREERPDIDQIYMEATQLMGQQGGWPLNVFCDFEGKPFFSGTYFPPISKHGLPSFLEVLKWIDTVFKEKPDQVATSTSEILKLLKEKEPSFINKKFNEKESYDDLFFQTCLRYYDEANGGFSFHDANKFPSTMTLSFLLKIYHVRQNKKCLEMVEKTLFCILKGGIYDQIGGGISRYSTDKKWLIPHFEKMLYDNALLMMVLLECYQITDKSIYKKAIKDIFNYLQRDMRHSLGGFYSAEDADSEGVEGAFYVWDLEELKTFLSKEEQKIIFTYYGLTKEGNFGEKNILFIDSSVEDMANRFNWSLKKTKAILKAARLKIFKNRLKRPRPFCDKKILLGWNALLISAYAKAARVLKEPTYLKEAKNILNFILTTMIKKKRLYKRFFEGDVDHIATLKDVANLIVACLDVYETCYEKKWLIKAETLTQQVLDQFGSKQGYFYEASCFSDKLFFRSFDPYDMAEPSGNSQMAFVFLKLYAYLEKDIYKKKSNDLFGSLSFYLKGIHSPLLLSFFYGKQKGFLKVVIVGPKENDKTKKLLSVVQEEYFPFTHVVFIERSSSFSKGSFYASVVTTLSISEKEAPQVIVCNETACSKPVKTPKELRKLLCNFL